MEVWTWALEQQEHHLHRLYKPSIFGGCASVFKLFVFLRASLRSPYFSVELKRNLPPNPRSVPLECHVQYLRAGICSLSRERCGIWNKQGYMIYIYIFVYTYDIWHVYDQNTCNIIQGSMMIKHVRRFFFFCVPGFWQQYWALSLNCNDYDSPKWITRCVVPESPWLQL